MMREASNSSGTIETATTSSQVNNRSPDQCAAQALKPAVTATTANNNSASLVRRLTAKIRLSAAHGAQIETFQSAIQRLTRQAEALRCAADISSSFTQAGFQHLLAQVLAFTGRYARRAGHVQISGGDHFLAREQLGTLDGIAQLAHVAGPVVRLQGRDGILAQLHFLAEKVPGERQYVGRSLRQRWHRNFDDIEPIVQILAEAPFAD